MQGLTVVHHHPKVLRRSEGTTLVIPTLYSGYVRVLLWIWFGIWGIVETALVLSLFTVLGRTTPFPIPSTAILAGLLTLFTLAGGLIAWRLIWVTCGREVLEITPTRLTLRREPGVSKSAAFDRKKIQELQVGAYDDNEIYPSWGRNFIGRGSRFISFRYDDKIHLIGRGLSTRDAEYVRDLLRPDERA